MESGKKQPKIIVFTSPTCSWCNAVKRYLRENHMSFRDVDVSRDAEAARDLARSGHRGVPVVLINNRPVVGFNKPEINRLLGIRG
ncbi:MAG: NrdH-redoxin [Candidatus Marinimicrobia bacterium CG08_land_8_20_14_0_20_45_22]|nr:MAG: NrdH-redoxin [Candidatus Marinimicrobia bacterium CG08_land_8_20_14_0_20_45_22]